MMEPLLILFLALLLDWFIGDPDWMWRRVPHPVVVFGNGVSFLDKRLNKTEDTTGQQYKKGSVTISILILVALGAGWLAQKMFFQIGMFGWALELLTVFVLLAQKSLFTHVKAVGDALNDGGLAAGRKAVAMIVGRDPETLDETGVCRAAIESLAENFSDGVVAPAFWYAVFGLPGLFAYKMINTADSMIAYKTPKYLWFGREAARIDDFANWVPARLSALLISGGAFFVGGIEATRRSFKITLKDHGVHRSPNAGWPESAMAGASDLALGGPRNYTGEKVEQKFINENGKRELDSADIDLALGFYKWACIFGWSLVILVMLISGN